MNKSQLTAIRFTNFSVGGFNRQTKSCENSWLEIKETDKPSENVYSNEILSNLTNSSDPNFEKSGKYCGILFNFLSSYYSSKAYVIINYQRLTKMNSENPDLFEIEISFYEKNLLSPDLFSKQNYGYSFANLNQGSLIENSKCNQIFSNCTNQKYDACLISSPNFPGSYLKNVHCQYQITIDEEPGKKLILINDNFQVGGELCQIKPDDRFEQFQLTSSYFCDSGPRFGNDCEDFINLYDGLDKKLDSKIIRSQVCGIGRLPKIVANKNSILMDFFSSPSGVLSNTGFLFYAMDQKKYFENYHLFNKFANTVSTTEELNSIIALEKLQVENCYSSGNECLITFNEEILNQIYPSLDSFKYNINLVICMSLI